MLRSFTANPLRHAFGPVRRYPLRALVPTFGLALATMFLLFFAAGCVAAQERWPGPSFREFSGVNQGGDPSAALFGTALSWNRNDVSWDGLEAKPGVWQQANLEQLGQRVLAYRKRSIEFLPVLDYTAPWAADRSPREWEYGNTRWKVKPRAGDTFEVSTFSRQPGGTWKPEKTTLESGGSLAKWPVAADHVKDWENYVRRVVHYLSQAPYNVRYFQIWNEAYPTSGFWFGDLDTYMQRVHLPAARIIHQEGGKVVYGGWPCIGPLPEFFSLLDRHHAWASIDVLDEHYLPTNTFETLRQAAEQRGRPDMAIWQTEIGFESRNLGFVSNTYPRMLYWALGHQWTRPDKYRICFFPQWAPDDPKAYGYRTGLYSGDHLSPHGRSLQTLATELSGAPLRPYTGVVAEPALEPHLDEGTSSMEAFAVPDRIVVAVHLNARAYGLGPAITLRFPLDRRLIAKAERVDVAGTRLDQTSSLTASGRDTTVQVDVADGVGADARKWNDSAPTRTFFVVLTLRQGSHPLTTGR